MPVYFVSYYAGIRKNKVFGSGSYTSFCTGIYAFFFVKYQSSGSGRDSGASSGQTFAACTGNGKFYSL